MKKDRPLVERIARRLRRLEDTPRNKFGTIATLTPLTVYLDGDLDETDTPIATPVTISMVDTLTVGQFVFCVEQHRRVVIVQAK